MPSNPSDSNESLLTFFQDDDDSYDYGDFGDLYLIKSCK